MFDPILGKNRKADITRAQLLDIQSNISSLTTEQTGKLDIVDFESYSGNTINSLSAYETIINHNNSLTGKLDIVDFESYSGNILNSLSTYETIVNHNNSLTAKLDVADFISASASTSGIFEAADIIDLNYTPTNYTATTSNLSGHLDGINTALLGGSGSQEILNVTGDFNIDQSMNGKLITNYGMTGDVSGTFASGLSAGFWVDVANEVGSGGIDSYTKLMLHMNGSNDGTTFTDSSSSKHTVTAINAVTKTAVMKFGTASGYFDGTGDYLSVADSADFQFGSSDFTLDFWFYPTNLTGYHTIIGASDQSLGGRSPFLLQTNNSGMQFLISTTTEWNIAVTAGTVNINAWNHVALVRSGTSFKGYLNGSSVMSETLSGSLYASGNPLIVAALHSENDTFTTYYEGYIDELRISKGAARWSDNFTPIPIEYFTGSQSFITLVPASGEQLPGTAASDNTLISSTKGDVKNFFNTSNSWISKYTNGTWVDSL